MDEFSRTRMIIGEDAMELLARSKVAVFGIGGVGSFAAEALARCGIGRLVLFDDDVVCITNINRQLIATHKTIGRKKVEVMKERILDINPKCFVEAKECFFSSENAAEVDFSGYNYIVDAIDTVSSKLVLIEKAREFNIPIISCMGAGNKLDPTKFEVADIYETSVCPLAKVMRKELRARGIGSLKVVYSKEEAIDQKAVAAAASDNNDYYDGDYNGHYGSVNGSKNRDDCKKYCVCPPGTKRKCTVRRQIPGSISFVPSVAGLIMAGEVIRDIIHADRTA